MDHWRSTPSSLIGVYGTRHTHTDNLADCAAGKTANRCCSGKCVCYDGCKYARNAVDVDDDHAKSHQDIKNAHKWNELAEQTCDFLRTAACNDIGQNAEQNAHHDNAFYFEASKIDILNTERTGYDLRCGQVGRGYEEGGENTDAEDERRDQPQLAPVALLAKSALHVVSRTAVVLTFFVGVTVVAAEGNLNLFQDHAEQGRKPHPHDGSRAACCDCGCNTGDVSESYGTADGS